MKARFDDYIEIINSALDGYFRPEDISYGRLLEAMRYSLLAGGKRIRPMLVLEFCRVSGGNYADALPVACAIEMLHTYSLIHDDLPCMDNDELRRGMPTCHVRFDEGTAVLAGDALQAEAYSTILTAPLPDAVRARCAAILARAAGTEGICGGQMLDIQAEGLILSKSELRDIHNRKTAAMIEAACLMGVAVGRGTQEQMEAATAFARDIGLAFQVRDDILDCVSTVEELGKPIGSDAGNHKSTFATVMGIEACENLVMSCTERAKEALRGAFQDTAFLEWLADRLATRRK
ncbi:MAG: polyprenyl synthetase family protein [Candidatus Heteroscillospira sp.]